MLFTDLDFVIPQFDGKIQREGDGVEIQNRIAQLLAERGWSEYRLSKEASLSQSTITNLFKRGNAPTLPTLEAICDAFGITLTQFFSDGIDPVELTEEQKKLFLQWTMLSEEKREILMDLMERLAEV